LNSIKQTKKETVEKFMEENNLDLMVLLDRKNELADIYGIGSLPTTLAINKDGEVLVGQFGMLTYEQMEQMYGYFEK